ncbi:hypothetical protein BSY240_121 [Agrobacterium sp. RAC06]|nr:hypothetical protein BSY240_121 [Agrobacterium sp. RAC06]
MHIEKPKGEAEDSREQSRTRAPIIAVAMTGIGTSRESACEAAAPMTKSGTPTIATVPRTATT